MFSGAVIILTGKAIAAELEDRRAVHGRTIRLGGRYLLHVSCYLDRRVLVLMTKKPGTISAPAYAVEIAPPHWRGRATAFYNIGWYGGAIPAAAITCE